MSNPPAPKLTARQRRFVQEYLKNPNGAQAARAAGFSAKSAKVQAARLLTNDNVSAAIIAGQSARSAEVKIDAARVLRELALVGFSDLGEILDFTGEQPKLKDTATITEAARRAIASIKVRRFTEGHGDEAREVEVTEFKLWDKLSALEKIAKHLGMLVDRHQHSGTVTVQHDLSRLSDEQLSDLERILAATTGADADPGTDAGTAPPPGVGTGDTGDPGDAAGADLPAFPGGSPAGVDAP